MGNGKAREESEPRPQMIMKLPHQPTQTSCTSAAGGGWENLYAFKPLFYEFYVRYS